MRMEERIRTKLDAAFKPERLDIVNDSARHAGHAGARSETAEGETHFNVLIVSAAFAGLGRVARHRAITTELKSEFAAGLHALQLTALAPGETALRT